ncbi:tyrosine-type recombinase/integrase [Clostridium sp.]|uniref:site-specific integrase n=1 Tax=Clostridium sp. TaxID=1506 RepID=UPI00283AEE3A|nr:tyrosine-type recombinase/integrase [Clostridium sp.]MDR3596537.1 tyrosine-type recombinase/integrase [Clostridium sp.]
MNLHFYLERKQLKSTERAIYCYIRGLAKGKTIQLNTKQRIRPEYWDKTLELAIERGKIKSPTARELNNFLSSYKDGIKKTVYQHLSMNPSADFEELRTEILEKFGRSLKLQLTLFEALNTFKEVRKKDMSPDSLRKYSTVIKHLKEYEKYTKSELTFSRLDMMFYDKFLSYLLKDGAEEKVVEKNEVENKEVKKKEKKKGMVNNSAYKIIGLLKIFLNWAYDRNINPYLSFKKWKIKEEKVDIITLTEQELKTLYNMKFAEDKKHLQRARDLFLFGCYTGGRFGDLSKIEHQDIRENKWYLRTGKTRDVLEIPLTDYALTIIARYSGTPYPLPRLSNQKLNKYIKEVCKDAKIVDTIKMVRYRGNTPEITEYPKWQEVTTHTARRTFITQSLLRGMKAEVVMSISGHHNYKTFKKYIDITSRDKENAIKNAWNENKELKVFNLSS